MNKNPKIVLNYVTNFKPKNLIDVKNKDFNKQIIFCKRFLVFILFFNVLLKSSKNMFNLVKIFIKPRYSNNIWNVLKAPYKNKLSRHQLTLSRYYIICSFLFKPLFFDTLSFSNPKQLLKLTTFFFKFFSLFETNICHQKKFSIFLNFKLKKFFFLPVNYK
uniref:ymf59 n=1 Tax=Cryptocaryon irritans TaxID=153251 RepID=UPI0022FD9E98|nr:ymf59 [Cryptocaryon irritans]WBP62342.1 ymf59 [Cryptocaryon irritans]